jgi:hypothetical protein
LQRVVTTKALKLHMRVLRSIDQPVDCFSGDWAKGECLAGCGSPRRFRFTMVLTEQTPEVFGCMLTMYRTARIYAVNLNFSTRNESGSSPIRAGYRQGEGLTHNTHSLSSHDEVLLALATPHAITCDPLGNIDRGLGVVRAGKPANSPAGAIPGGVGPQ